jgi:hypothetical protein
VSAEVESGRVVDVRVALPADWWVIPLLDPAERQHAEHALVARQLHGRPDDDPLRAALIDALTAQTGAAAAAGARLLALGLQHAEGVPIPASLVLHWWEDIPNAEGALLNDLEDSLRPEPGTEPSGFSLDLAKLPSGRALRRVTVEAATGDDNPESLVVDYWVERPDGGLVHLAFASPILPLRDALLSLFDAVAGALRWVHAARP